MNLSSKRLREPAHVVLQLAVRSQELNVCSVNLDLTSPALLEVLVATKGSKTPVLGDNDLLAAGEPKGILTLRIHIKPR